MTARAVALLGWGCALFIVVSAIIGLLWALIFYIFALIILVLVGAVAFGPRDNNYPDDPDDPYNL